MKTTQHRIDIYCPECGKRLRASERHLGTNVRCLGCKQEFIAKRRGIANGEGRNGKKREVSGEAAGEKSLHPFHLDRPVFNYGSLDPVFWWCLVRGFLALGATGSGKSSAVLKLIVSACLRLGAGGIFFTTKSDDCETYQELAKLSGRESDVVVLDSDNGVFNWMDWEASHRQGSFTENIVELFYSLSKLADGGGGDGQGEAYWRFALKQLIRHAITLLVLADEVVSLLNINRVITSMPSSPEQCHDSEWQESSYCCQLLGHCTSKTLDESSNADLEMVGTFLMQQMPELHPKTRGIITSSFTGLAEVFLFGKYRRMFSSGKSTITPEQTWADEKNILIINLPIDVHQESGRLAQLLIKRCFQRAVQAREPKENQRPVLCVCDEAQYLVDAEADLLFTSNCRSKGVVNFWLSQSIDAIYSACGGGPKGEQSANAILANLTNKILLQQSGSSAEWASKLFGEHYTFLDYGGGSISPSMTGGGGHGGASKQLQPRVLPSALYDLKTGGKDGIVSGYVWSGGTNFSNGEPVMKVEFAQEHEQGGE